MTAITLIQYQNYINNILFFRKFFTLYPNYCKIFFYSYKVSMKISNKVLCVLTLSLVGLSSFSANASYYDYDSGYSYPKNDPVYDAGKTDHVRGYDRQDGTHVDGYDRHHWGTVCRKGNCNY